MAVATAHNGGLTEVNFNFLGAGDYPFINIVKCAQNWNLAGAGPHQGEWVDPSTMDSDGYPTTLPAGGVITTGPGPSDPTLLASSWTMAWDGNGTVAPPATVVTGSATSSGGSGSLTFIPTGQAFNWGIVSTAAAPNHIRNIRICLTSKVSDLAAGEVFTPEFKQGISAAKFGVLRFLNWQSANTTNLTTWATRRPATYFNYAGYEFRPSLYCGATGGSANAYTISGNGTGVPASGAPTDKMTIHVKFHANASGTSTLALNGTTAKALRYPTGSTGILPVGLSGTVIIYSTLVFDAALDSWLLYNEGSQGLDGCVPPEICAQLCAETGTHPWFTLPIMASGPPTDFYTQLATHIRDTYNGSGGACPWMVPIFEGPNEMFNFGYHFYQTALGHVKAPVLWGSGSFLDYAGMISSQLGQDIAAVYSITQPNVATQTKYKTVIGLQTYGGLNGSDEKFNSTLYVNQAAAASGYTKSAAKDWNTHACIATYYAPAEYRTHAEVNRAIDYYQRGDIAIVDAFLESHMGDGTFSLPAFQTLAAQWKTYIKTFGINKLLAYEGGYSPDFYQPTPGITAMTNAAQMQVTIESDYPGLSPSGPQALIGRYMHFFGVSGMTEVNGNRYQIVNVSGNTYTLNVDSTGFGTYTSGGNAVFYMDSGAVLSLYTVMNTMKDAGKYRSILEAVNTAIYQSFVGLTDATFTAEYPSHYLFAGPVGAVANGSVWDLQNDIFESPKSAQYRSIQNFNAVKRASPPRMRLHA